MNAIRQIQELNKRELESAVSTEGSWHADYRDTAYIYIGGLPFELSEGDVITIFSQFGEPVYINMVRDKETGKSKGFAFLKYEDQRSTDLAVDNLGGATVMGRVLKVDHTRYKRKEGEEEVDNTGWNPNAEAEDEGEGRRKKRRTESESEEERPLLKEEIELAKLIREHDDDDPMKAFMVKEKREEVEEALKKLQKSKKKGDKHKHHSKRHRQDRSRDGERTNRRIKDASEEPDSRRKERSRRDHSADRDRRAKRDSEEFVSRRKDYPRRDHSRDRERDRRRDRSGSRDRRHRD
jgi:RNA-binding motif X-linked protein 2